jgi:hypothetical protein
MTRKVDLGAPSLTGKDANDLVAKEFAKIKYPVKISVTNHMPRNAVFPEVDGLLLRHCADEAGRKVEVIIESEDQFQRLASSVEQIAELNGYELALTIEEVAVVAPSKGKAGGAATTETQTQ